MLLTTMMPLQIAEAKEAGAAGVIGVVAQVLGNGAPVMTSFAAAIGLDAPLEVRRCCPDNARLCCSHPLECTLEVNGAVSLKVTCRAEPSPLLLASGGRQAGTEGLLRQQLVCWFVASRP